MAINLDKPQRWKEDVARSVDMYNQWFLDFAPGTFRATRISATASVEASLLVTSYLRDIRPQTMRETPSILATLRMATCPPLAVDRLIGLAGVNPSLVKTMEKDNRLPVRMAADVLDRELQKIGEIVERMADPDIFVWLARGDDPKQEEIHRAATIVADRLCGAQANPIIRNEQEKRQLTKVKAWLEARGYTEIDSNARVNFLEMEPGTFSFRLNVKVRDNTVNIPVDAVIMPLNAGEGDLPLLIEAKSAGDFTNTNKRRKEEATKMAQLKQSYGESVSFVLFLCGYFDSGYLGYEAAEGIDWIWEHRIDDMAELGL
ncbi:XamI family restriction endonuclease [Klebsiella michiganensis]|uniref:XamI family restriction endonuclease n=1 Tax=Klebsiella michiganensis TaxID=1134687 RepID=UPI001E5BBADD|nr:XamI family restriction endonuclease [Klebsiella michiganensis]UHC89227.1 XamI family restriction endonuclease [Klebsiella michiganensis]